LVITGSRLVPQIVTNGTIDEVSTNLRLSEELAGALREAAARSGRSQQDIVREAIAKELGLTPDMTAMELAVRAGLVEAPDPFRDVEPTLTLPDGALSSELLDREDR
jgi:predicted DNA-binding protein